MQDILVNYYFHLKALHIIAFIAWMAGLLYLPRLFVYHSRVDNGGQSDLLFQEMERKLLRYIMNPAMIITFLAGIALYYVVAPTAWFHLKALLVLLLAGTHGMMAVMRKKFAEGRNNHSEKFFRWFNELPTVLMIGIVVLAVFKPF